MSDGSPQPRGDAETDTGAKPSIAEVAAWLRRAAESRDAIEELRPVRRPVAPAPPPPVEPVEPLPVDRAGAEEPPVVQEPAADEAARHEPPPDEPALDEPSLAEPALAEPVLDEAALDEAAMDETSPPASEPPLAAHEASAGAVVEPAAPFDRLSDEATVWAEPADPAAASPVRDDDAPAPTGPAGQAQPEAAADEAPAAAAPAEAAPSDHDRGAGSRPLWVGDADDPDDAEGAAPREPEPDVPVVSPALALFASAVVRHNTAEVTAIRPERDDLPKAEALVEEELPLAGDEDADSGSTTVAAVAPEAPPVHGAAASLFDLDLAELAARARGRAEERALGAAPPPPPPPPPPDVDAFDPDVEHPALEVRNEPVDASGLDLPWDIEAYHPAEGDLLDDDAEVEAGDEDQPAEEAARPKTPAKASLAAALARRRARRKRYPRGQLKERIGFLRRVRAMLGVVVLTVVLGVAAGTAIGAFLVFLAFAVRSAITSS